MKLALVLAFVFSTGSVSHAEPALYADADDAVRALGKERGCKAGAKATRESGAEQFDPCEVLRAFLGAKTPKLAALAGSAYVGRSFAMLDGGEHFEFSTLVIAPFAPPPASTSEHAHTREIANAIDHGVAPSIPDSSLVPFEAHLRSLKGDDDAETAAIRAHLSAVRRGKPAPKSKLTAYLVDLVARRESRQLARTRGPSLVHFKGSNAIFVREIGNRLVFVELDADPARAMPPTRAYVGELFLPARR